MIVGGHALRALTARRPNWLNWTPRAAALYMLILDKPSNMKSKVRHLFMRLAPSCISSIAATTIVLPELIGRIDARPNAFFSKCFISNIFDAVIDEVGPI